jgi:hypothetical protein
MQITGYLNIYLTGITDVRTIRRTADVQTDRVPYWSGWNSLPALTTGANDQQVIQCLHLRLHLGSSECQNGTGSDASVLKLESTPKGEKE